MSITRWTPRIDIIAHTFTMYRESFDFPVLEEKQRVEWDGVPVVIVKTQLHLSNWGHLVLDIVFDENVAKEGFPLDRPIYPLEKLPPIQALYNDEQLFFQLKDFIPFSLDCIFEPYEGYKIRATASPIIPRDKSILNATREAFIPRAAFGSANAGGICYQFDNSPFTSDTVEFMLGNRKWKLRSLVETNEYMTLYECRSESSPRIQLSDKGILLQTRADGLTQKDFEEECSKICFLLEIALGTPIIPYIYSLRLSDGSRYPYCALNIRTHPQGNWGPLRTEQCNYRLPIFIQKGYSEYEKSKKWWNITCHWYVLMLCTHEVDAGNFYASLLFDRIFDYVSKKDKEFEPWLNSHPRYRKDMKGMRITYNGKISYLAEIYGIDFDSKRFTKRRNALVHEGEPDFDYPNNVINSHKTINFISKIILSLLSYDGDYQKRRTALDKE